MKGLLPGILRIKDRKALGVVNARKSFQFLKWWVRGCVRKFNFDPTLQDAVRTSMQGMPRPRHLSVLLDFRAVALIRTAV
jgi:hypothetical protein